MMPSSRSRFPVSTATRATVLALALCSACNKNGTTDVDTDTDDDTDVIIDTDGDTDDIDTDDDTDLVPEGIRLSGTLRYESPTSTCVGGCRLDYTNIVTLPVRHARLLLLDDEGATLAESRTAADGSFDFTYDGLETSGSLYALASIKVGQRVELSVVDNTDDSAQWGGSLGDVDLTADSVTNAVFEHGFNGTSYDARAAAPFAVADSIYRISDSYLSADPTYDLVPLTVYWSPDNRPESGDTTVGEIGTSYFSSEETAVYVLGAADIDTDEFDSSVLLHEWTHFMQAEESRSDSIGGDHGDGDVLDPRVAFGEGLGNAVSGLINPGSEYVDSSGSAQADGFGIDLEAAPAHRGWWSEAAIQSVIYDLFDPTDDGLDTISLSIPELWTRMVQDERDTPAFNTIFSFIHAVKVANPTSAAAIDTLTVAARFGPVTDEYGTGETHDNGWSENLPVYSVLTVGGAAITQSFDGTVQDNGLEQYRYARFVGTGASVQITSTSDEDVDFVVFESGVELTNQNNTCQDTPCVETATLNTVVGVDYVVAVQGYGEVFEYTATLEMN